MPHRLIRHILPNAGYPAGLIWHCRISGQTLVIIIHSILSFKAKEKLIWGEDWNLNYIGPEGGLTDELWDSGFGFHSILLDFFCGFYKNNVGLFPPPAQTKAHPTYRWDILSDGHLDKYSKKLLFFISVSGVNTGFYLGVAEKLWKMHSVNTW